MVKVSDYFSGKKLFGDDFTQEEISKWFDEEAEGYYGLVKDTKASQIYQYHSMNEFYGFRHIDKTTRYRNALGIGSAFGQEFIPIIDQIDKLTILEPSDNMRSAKIGSIVPAYVKPTVNGVIEFPDSSFDLITCFGTLHHIPNVKFVLNEIIRVLKPGGFLLMREPIRTMGDWRLPRRGLTRNERGIPHAYFTEFFTRPDVHVVRKTFCESLFAKSFINRFLRVDFSSKFYPRIDDLLSAVLKWNVHYHPTSFIQKISPGSVFFVVRKK